MTSLRTGRPGLGHHRRPRLGPTLLLVGLGTLFATVLGILIGIKGGWQRGSRFDTSTLYGLARPVLDARGLARACCC